MNLTDIIEAMEQIAPVEVVCRDNGSWYAHWLCVEVKDDGILKAAMGEGMSYAEALRDCWSAINALPPGQWLVLDAYDPTGRREFRRLHGRWVDRTPRRRAA